MKKTKLIVSSNLGLMHIMDYLNMLFAVIFYLTFHTATI